MRFRSFIIFLSALFASAFACDSCASDCLNRVVVEKMGSKKSMPLSGVLDDGPVFVIVWASFCNPCVEKIPSIPRLQDTLKSRGLKTRVVMVSVDRKKENANLKKANAACGDTNFSLSQVLQLWTKDFSSVIGEVGSRSIPIPFAFWMYKLDKKGKYIRLIKGRVPEKGGWDCKDVVSQIQSFEQCGADNIIRKKS